MIPGSGNRRHLRAAAAVIHCLRRAAAHAAIGVRAIGQRVTVDREAGSYGKVGRNSGIGTGRGGNAVAPGDEVITGVRHGCHLRAATAVVHRLRSAPVYAAVVPSAIGQRVTVDREAGRHRKVGRNSGIGTRRGRNAVAPGYEIITGVRHGRHLRAATAVVHRLRSAPVYAAVGSRAIG